MSSQLRLRPGVATFCLGVVAVSLVPGCPDRPGGAGHAAPANAAARPAGMTVIDVTAPPYGAKCDCVVNPATMEVTGTDDTDAVNRAIAALPQAPIIGNAFGAGGGIIVVPALCRVTSPIVITKPYVTFQGVGTFNHATSSIPPSGLVFAPAKARSHAVTIAGTAPGCNFRDIGILTAPTGGAAVRSLSGQLTLRGVKLHALAGSRPGAVPNAADGTGLLIEGLQSNVRCIESYVGGYSIGIEAANVPAFSMAECQVIGNGIGLRVGQTGGASAVIYGNNCFQDNAIGNIDIVRAGLVDIRGNYFEYGAGAGLPGWHNPFCVRVGNGSPDVPKSVAFTHNFVQGNVNAKATAVIVSRVSGMQVEWNNFTGATGTVVEDRGLAVTDLTVQLNQFEGAHGPILKKVP